MQDNAYTHMHALSCYCKLAWLVVNQLKYLSSLYSTQQLCMTARVQSANTDVNSKQQAAPANNMQPHSSHSY